MKPTFRLHINGELYCDAVERNQMRIDLSPDLQDAMYMLYILVKNQGPYGDALHSLLTQAFEAGVRYEQQQNNYYENDSLSRLISQPISTLRINPRTYNALIKANMRTIAAVIVKKDSANIRDGIMGIPGIGNKCGKYITAALAKLGLSLGMKIIQDQGTLKLVRVDGTMIEKVSDLKKVE